MESPHEFIHERITLEIQRRRELEDRVQNLELLISKLVTYLNYTPNENQDKKLQ